MENPNVLIIEDEIQAADALVELFSFHGVRTETANDALVAMEALSGKTAESVDLVLTDLNVPYLSGEKLVASIAATRPGVPIVAMTGSVEDMEQLQCNIGRYGLVTILKKPIKVIELLDLIDEILD